MPYELGREHGGRRGVGRVYRGRTTTLRARARHHRLGRPPTPGGRPPNAFADMTSWSLRISTAIWASRGILQPPIIPRLPKDRGRGCRGSVWIQENSHAAAQGAELRKEPGR
jgi:hypothetical protein